MTAHLVENLHRFVELYIPQERGQVLEEINQQLRVHGPTLQDKVSLLNQNSITANMHKAATCVPECVNEKVFSYPCIPSAAVCALTSWR